MIKLQLFFNWQLNLFEAQGTIQELERRLEYQRYEYDVITRVLEATQDEEEREHWQTDLAVAHDAISMIEGDLDEQQKEVERCNAVLAVIKADLDAEGINPDDYDIEDFIFDEDEDDFDYDYDPDFDMMFDDDEIPF